MGNTPPTTSNNNGGRQKNMKKTTNNPKYREADAGHHARKKKSPAAEYNDHKKKAVVDPKYKDDVGHDQHNGNNKHNTKKKAAHRSHNSKGKKTNRDTLPEELKGYDSLKNRFAEQERRHLTYEEMMSNRETRHMILQHEHASKMLKELCRTKQKFPYDVVRLDTGEYRTVSAEDGIQAGNILKIRDSKKRYLKAGHTTLSHGDERVLFAGEIQLEHGEIVINRYSGHYEPDLDLARKQVGKNLREHFKTRTRHQAHKKKK